RLVGLPELAGNGRDIDDPAAATPAHGGQDGLGGPDRAHVVRPHHSFDVVDVVVLEEHVAAVPGVVDQQVDAAGALDDLANLGFHARALRHVADVDRRVAAGTADLRRHLLEAVGAARKQRDTHAP